LGNFFYPLILTDPPLFFYTVWMNKEDALVIAVCRCPARRTVSCDLFLGRTGQHYLYFLFGHAPTLFTRGERSFPPEVPDYTLSLSGGPRLCSFHLQYNALPH
jgi:hypothetical protein